MDWIWSFVVGVLWWLAGWLWWLVSTLLWALLWTVLPLAVVAFGALRLADYVLGRAVVQAWVRTQALKFGAGTFRRTRVALFALGTLPLRVLGWLVVYTLWHSIVSLFWTPRWRPWQRAWSRRWRRVRA